MRIFITGGAGYIGSHIVRLLGEQRHEILVYDDLSSGNAWAVLHGRLIQGDVGDRERLGTALAGFRPDAVIHLAASIKVEESVREPLKYYRNNTVNSLVLLECMVEQGIRNIVFSSTAAVYGMPSRVPVPETEPLAPVNPYGSSKAAVETILADLGRTGSIRSVSLRYFNVAGASFCGRIGQAYQSEPTHLITRTLRAAAGDIGELLLFGTDYPTNDGTCLRDYIHVDDLAEAHVLALEHLLQDGQNSVYNCGYGRGYSVREIVNAVRLVTGREVPVREVGRREGDVAVLIADPSRIKRDLRWRPRHEDLESIIRSAWEWELKLKQNRPHAG